jgi:hypothetical protein
MIRALYRTPGGKIRTDLTITDFPVALKKADGVQSRKLETIELDVFLGKTTSSPAAICRSRQSITSGDPARGMSDTSVGEPIIFSCASLMTW